MVIANSMSVNGRFTRVDFSSLGSEPTVVPGRDPSSESNVGARRSVALVAPGSNLQTITPDGETAAPASGTSFAAPHVAATVALLQEFGDRSIREVVQSSRDPQETHWGLDARHQLVMKAVLMNSADKIEDNGNGLHLGMTRTLRSPRNRTWLESDAYESTHLPLDADLGTGHLNAFRAYQQFSPGQWQPGRIPAIGWDYRTVSLPTDRSEQAPRQHTAPYRDYFFDAPLKRESFISATLAWDRVVDLQDQNNNGQYDVGESFVDRHLNDLNLYLMPALANDISEAIWASNSPVDSVEHIFFQIPQTGQYKLRVVFDEQVNEPIQPYALAWWSVEE
ncbi:S8 family serine peptidase [Egbenema bharatensis]|uniref:S8 family serine peptidase n=1 Tax=Egbenema bharatensis TaxID=3463334 RepID=UPI003A88E9B7